MMWFRDKQVSYITLFISLLLHAALFLQFSNAAVSSSQAQAPVYDTRISLNLLNPIQETKQKIAEVKPNIESEKPARKKIIKKQKVEQKEIVQVTAPKIDKEIKRQQDSNITIQQRYFSKLLTHIEGYKHYPRKARSRKIEGNINISFDLQENGQIENLTASGGALVLRRSAKNSVNNAVPLPRCPPEIKCPMYVTYAMQFKLQQN